MVSSEVCLVLVICCFVCLTNWYRNLYLLNFNYFMVGVRHFSLLPVPIILGLRQLAITDCSDSAIEGTCNISNLLSN